MDRSSPAKLYCLLIGAALVLAGLIGFFYEASFAAGDEIVSDTAFGLLAVNGWRNVVHMAIGFVLLAAAGGAARAGAMLFGVLYLVLAALGFIATGGDGTGFIASNGVLFELVPVNDEDNVLHIILGVTGVIAALATPKGAPAPAAA